MRAQGFSLIELMIVIAVIAVINLVMYPNFTSLQRSAKELSAKSSARNVMVALEQYFFIHQAYPEGENVSISFILPTLKADDCIRSEPINPYTSAAYTSEDASGQLIYSRSQQDEYSIKGYGLNNQTLIFEYP